MIHKRNFYWIVLALCAMMATSCSKKEGCTDNLASNYDADAEKDCCCEYASNFNFEMHFNSFVGAEALVQGETYIINGVATRLDLIQFYISNIRLVNEAGAETAVQGKYLLVKPSQEEYEIGELPVGEFTKIRFDIGIDSVTNHADPSVYAFGDPLGAQFPNMHWGWDFGYIFSRIDAVADKDLDGTPEDGSENFEMHIGTDKNLASIEIDYAFTGIAKNVFAAHFVINWLAYFDGVEMTGDITTHSDDDLLDPILIGNVQNLIGKEE